VKGYLLKYCFLGLLLFGVFCNAQRRDFPIDFISEPFFFTLDENQKPSFYSGKNHYHFQNGVFTSHSIKETFNEIQGTKNKKQIDFEFLTHNGLKYFILKGLGIVLEVDESGFKRIDKSLELRSNFASNFFSYKENIFSYGGYGYWNYHQNLLFYNSQNAEWNNFNIDQGFIPEGRAYAFGKLINDRFVFLGGKTNSGFSKEIIEFDFTNNSYKLLGSVDIKFKDTLSAPNLFSSISKNENLYFFNKKSEKELSLIDFEKLTFSSIKNNDLLKNLNSNYPILSANDSIYFISEINGENNLTTLPLNYLVSFFPERKSLVNIREKVVYVTEYILIILISFLLLLVILRLYNISRRIRGQVLLKGNYLSFRGDIIILSLLELEILEKLILNNHLFLDELYKLDSLEKYANSYKKNLIIKTLKELKQRIKSQSFLSKKLKLKISSDSNDKRRKVIFLKGSVVPYSGWFNYLIPSFKSY